MVKRRKKYTRHHDRFADGYAFDLDPEIKKSILIIGLIAFGGISLLSLFGLAGVLGGYVEQGLALLLGWGRWLFPIFLLALGFSLYNEDKNWIHGYTYVGLFFFVLSFQSLLHIFFQTAPETAASLGKGGGYTGLFLAKIFVSLIGFWATLLVLICLFAVSLMLVFNSNLSGLVGEESLFRKIFSPILRLLKRDRGEYDDEDEDGEEEENEEEEAEEDEAEYEEGEEAEEFSSRAVAGEIKTVSNQVEKEEPKIMRSNIKIQIPLDLLSGKVGKPSGADIKNSNEIIKRTLENFGIPVEMGDISVGPTVTQYTFKPAEGVKLSRITSLNNDLALSLAMHPIRIEAPIPGKSLVGIEVPNRVIARVGLREILDTSEFKQRKYNTMIALGKDVSGQAWMANLAKMPHLLVAGTTGSGKSVCLNTIIVSLLYQNNPDDLKFIMVDPKRVELPVYNGIPYLLSPVITDVPRTINALKWCLNEMDRRFDVLAAAGKRDIASYNAISRDRLPYLVFVIDELADLMVAAARDVEGAIIRLAQMARAVGIHLVLATQRPSVDVITGLIKANIPARIAFSVSSAIDSRTILDSQGAEKLLGRGDMLFVTAELSKPKRIQGAYVDDREIKKIVRHIKEQAGEVNYDEAVTGKQKVGGMAGTGFNGDEDSDDLYEEAKEIVINSHKASTSFLQRRLRIGYARAARLIDILEENGIVGPSDGAKAREILISQEQYAKVSEEMTSGMPLHNRAESNFNINEVLGEDENYEEEEEDDEEEEENEITETKKLETDETDETDEIDDDGDDGDDDLPPINEQVKSEEEDEKIEVEIEDKEGKERDEDEDVDEEEERMYSR